jgi:GTP cyclohydrolase I
MTSKSERLANIERAITLILDNLGASHLSEDVRRRTPRRAARSLLELTGGYEQDPDAIINGAYYPIHDSGPTANSGLVVVRDIHFHSLCAHHLLPFIGRAHVAYLPADRIIGLSKIPRLVNLYAHRLQVQEHLTAQIAALLLEKLAARGVGVILEAFHLCAMLRGVRDCSANLVTHSFLGELESDPAQRQQFTQIIFAHPQPPPWDG